MKQFCSNRGLTLISFRDIVRLFHDGAIKTEIGQESVGRAIGVLTPLFFSQR